MITIWVTKGLHKGWHFAVEHIYQDDCSVLTVGGLVFYEGEYV